MRICFSEIKGSSRISGTRVCVAQLDSLPRRREEEGLVPYSLRESLKDGLKFIRLEMNAWTDSPGVANARVCRLGNFALSGAHVWKHKLSGDRSAGEGKGEGRDGGYPKNKRGI